MKKEILFLALLATSPFVYNSVHKNNPKVLAKEIIIRQPAHVATSRIEKGIGFIDIFGEINDNSADVIHKAIRSFESKHITQIMIHLNSLGGPFTPGEEIVTDMQEAAKNGVDVVTLVDHKEYCANMCTVVFAAGSTRMAADDTLWLFRAPYIKLTADEMKDPRILQEATDAVKECEDYILSVYKTADPEWTEKVLEKHITESDNQLVLTGGEIIAQKNTWINIEIEDKSHINSKGKS